MLALVGLASSGIAYSQTCTKLTDYELHYFSHASLFGEYLNFTPTDNGHNYTHHQVPYFGPGDIAENLKEPPPPEVLDFRNNETVASVAARNAYSVPFQEYMDEGDNFLPCDRHVYNDLTDGFGGFVVAMRPGGGGYKYGPLSTGGNNSGNSGRSVGGGNNPGANSVSSGGSVGGSNDLTPLDTNRVSSDGPVDENDNPPLETSNSVSSDDGSISGNFVQQKDDGRVKISLDVPTNDNAVTVSGATDNPKPNDDRANIEHLDSGTLPRNIDLDANAMPSGIWADGGNLWVISDWLAGELRVYSLADGLRQMDLGFGLDAGHVYPAALWSDGATLWVADFQAGVLAYRLADGARLPAQDFDETVMLAAGNIAPSGLWSDGKVIWVTDFLASRAFAYLLSDKSRLYESDLDLTGVDGERIYPMGLTSDGRTALTSNWITGEMHGFDLSSGTRLPVHDINMQMSGIQNLMGLSFDGRTLYVLDELAKRVQAIFLDPGLH